MGSSDGKKQTPLVPAKAGIQKIFQPMRTLVWRSGKKWIPAFAGMSEFSFQKRKLRIWTLDVSNTCFLREKFLRQETRLFDEVSAIYARQVNAATYDENLLVFELMDGSLISIGETDCGLQALEAALRWFGVEGDWYSPLERGGPGTELCLYRKKPEN